MSRESHVQEFHEAFDHPVNERITQPCETELLERHKFLVMEEATEFRHAVNAIIVNKLRGKGVRAEDLWSLLKEMADLQYVLSGFAVAFGLPLEEAFERTHDSNMSKLDPDTGQPVYREDGKILKGANYQPPDLLDLAIRSS